MEEEEEEEEEEEILFYLTNGITSNSGRCACRQAAQRLPVFKICHKVGGPRFLI
jgi:hypothetical protein